MVTSNILLTISGPNILRPLVICLGPLQIVYMVNTKYHKRCSGVEPRFPCSRPYTNPQPFLWNLNVF
jgi:hypothetical protein